MVERLMEPGVTLKGYARTYVVRMRERLASGENMQLGPSTYERLCRIAQAAGVLARRRRIPRVDERLPAAPALHVPERFRLGASIPVPPKLRRPVVALGGGSTETWDPAGAPGL